MVRGSRATAGLSLCRAQDPSSFKGDHRRFEDRPAADRGRVTAMLAMRKALAVLALASAIGCAPRDLPTGSYFDDNIQPILSTSCVRQNTGCHLATPAGTAVGNLDMSSFDSLMRRDDVLDPYGPYPLPLALLKTGDPITIRVETFGETDGVPLEDRLVDVTTDIRHAGGSTFDLGTSGFALVQQWVRNGHTRTGSPPRTLRVSEGACRSGAGTAPGFDPSAAPGPGFGPFVASVNSVLVSSCAGGVCHGNPSADMYLSCGATDAEQRWNYWVATQFVSESTSVSEILRRPLSVLRGGTFHEGGDVIDSTEDVRYRAIFDWAASLTPEELRPTIPPGYSERGLRFFANRVQPVLVQKGCMFLNCHSPSMFHDLRLRGGSGGHFGRLATVLNYDIARALLAVDSDNPNESRLIAKNLFPGDQVAGGDGIQHRGGSLLEDFGVGADGAPNAADPTDCAAFSDDQLDHDPLSDVPAYCIFARWHDIEHEEAHPGLAPAEVVSAVVWVNRPAGVGRPEDFDTYRPGATLRSASAVSPPTGPLALGGDTELSASCGFPAGQADIRGPAASWDGTFVAFAARTSASTPYRLYRVMLDGSGCAPIPGIAPATDSASGILLHDFDPAFAPDGRMVFASTRGYLSDGPIGRTGPTRTPASLAPNANLFVVDADGSVRQLTFLLNQEMQPSFMGDGRIIFTAEKRELEFHQFAGRRLNLDGGDYHPLFGQRESVGFRSTTEIVELLDRNLAMVAAPLDAVDGAGTIAIVNRSIGPDQDDRDPADRQFIHSIRYVSPSAFSGGTGAFRSPYPLPNGHLLVSCAPGATSLTAGPFAFELCDLDPDSGDVVPIGGGAGANVEGVAVFAREGHPVFRSSFFEANGHTEIVAGDTNAQILYADLPMLGTLMFGNRRTGRPIDQDVEGVDVFESLAPPDGATSFGDASVASSVMTDAFGQFFVSRRMTQHVDLAADGSAHILIRGGMPMQLRLTDRSGTPLMFDGTGIFTGEMIQRETVQFYPGERIRQSMPRSFFNSLCGGCHGSISNRELDIAADIDILTRASPRILARDEAPIDAR
jgi:hypothetical protein